MAGAAASLPERGHHFLRKQPHRFFDYLVRDSAEVKCRRDNIEAVVLHRIVNDPDALIRIAIEISSASQHSLPVIVRLRFHRALASNP